MGRKGVLRAKTCELGMALGQSVGESITWFGNGGWVGGVGALRSTIAAQAGRVCVCVHVWVGVGGKPRLLGRTRRHSQPVQLGATHQ